MKLDERNQGDSVVVAREAAVTQHFLFVQQEGARTREPSAGNQEDFSHPDRADNGLHPGRTEGFLP